MDGRPRWPRIRHCAPPTSAVTSSRQAEGEILPALKKCNVSTLQLSNSSTFQRLLRQGVRVMRRLWLIGALLVFVAAPPSGAQQPVIKVGVVVDVTGGASSLGVPERNTVLLYQDDLGTALGPNGPARIEYVVTDGESDPAKAAIAAKESFARAATDVSTQVTRAMGRNPQAFLIWAIPPGANVSQRNIRDLGITLPVYQSHGVANKTFLDLGAASVDGTFLPSGKILIAEQLPDTDKQKMALLGYVERYEGRYGKGTRNTFGGHALDAMLILRPAIERTLWQGIRPENTGGFRAVLRDQIEHGTKELVGITGIFNYTPTDHLGLDLRAAVMVEVRNGTWMPAR